MQIRGLCLSLLLVIVACVELERSTLIGEHKIPNEWFDEPQPEKWTLLYRATKHGFDVAEFHSRCDNKGPTITLVKSEFGGLFGGYTPISWTSPNMFKYYYDPKTFLFSLEGPKTKEPTKLKNNGPQCNSTYSVKHSAFTGPGFGQDIRKNKQHITNNVVISDQADKGAHSFSNLGHSFSAPEGLEYGTLEIRSFLGGFPSFIVREIEVFGIKEEKDEL